MKTHDKVSLLSSFSELKFDHRFEHTSDRQACMQNFETSQNISPPLIPTSAKPYNQVSLLTNFSELKFDRRFILAFGR